jgi:hypothetical protein
MWSRRDEIRHQAQLCVSIGRPYFFHFCVKADGPNRRRRIVIILYCAN